MITADQLSQIADQFNFADDKDRKNAIDHMNNNIFDGTTIEELTDICKLYAA